MPRKKKIVHSIREAGSLAELAEAIRLRVWNSIETDGPAIRLLTGSIVHGAHDVYQDPVTGKKRMIIPFHDRPTIPAVKEGAKQCAQYDQVCELKRIFTWARKNTRYLPDILGIDTYQNHRYSAKLKGGDCDDYTIMIAAMCKSIGIECFARVVATIGDLQSDEPSWSHIYPVALVESRGRRLVVPIDLTIPKPLGSEYTDIAVQMDFPLHRDSKIKRGQYKPKWRVKRPPMPKKGRR